MAVWSKAPLKPILFPACSPIALYRSEISTSSGPISEIGEEDSVFTASQLFEFHLASFPGTENSTTADHATWKLSLENHLSV
jgi:hypothetical protein